MADRKPDMFWRMVIKHKWVLAGEIFSKYRIVQTCLSPGYSVYRGRLVLSFGYGFGSFSILWLTAIVLLN